MSTSLARFADIIASLDDALTESEALSTSITPIRSKALLAKIQNLPSMLSGLRDQVMAMKEELKRESALWVRDNGEVVQISEMNNEHLMNSLHRLAYVVALAKAENKSGRTATNGVYLDTLAKLRTGYGLPPINYAMLLHYSLMEVFPVAEKLSEEIRRRDLPVLVSVR